MSAGHSNSSLLLSPQVCLPATLVNSSEVFFWGSLLSILLFGLVVAQGWTYLNCNNDRWQLRSLAACLITVDFVSMISIAALAHYYFITSFGDPSQLLVLPSFSSIESISTAVLTFVVQLFFAYRVFTLNRKNFPALFGILLTALAAFTAGLMAGIRTIFQPELAMFATPLAKLELSLHTGLAALCDVIATVFFSLPLSNVKTPFKRTRRLLQRLLLFAVTRGILVTATQILTLVVYLAWPNDLYWTPFHFSMGRLYVLTTIFMLNTRESVKTSEQQDSSAVSDGIQIMISQTSSNDSVESTAPKFPAPPKPNTQHNYSYL